MKQSEIDPEKMRSLINGHSIQITKPSASANLANKNNKQKSDEDQFKDQFNKRQQINHENQESKNSENESMKKYNYCDKISHFKKNY